jgi:hypothetical protein
VSDGHTYGTVGGFWLGPVKRGKTAKLSEDVFEGDISKGGRRKWTRVEGVSHEVTSSN